MILGDIQLHAQHSVVRNCSPKASWTVMEVGRLPAPKCFGTFFGSELIEATATSSIECGLLEPGARRTPPAARRSRAQIGVCEGGG